VFARYKNLSGIGDDDPMIQWISKGGRLSGRVVTVHGLNKILQNLFKEHFKDGTKISSHSFRIGMTQSLAERGFGVVELQQSGRWTNPVMPYEYTKNQSVSRSAVAKMYQQVK